MTMGLRSALTENHLTWWENLICLLLMLALPAFKMAFDPPRSEQYLVAAITWGLLLGFGWLQHLRKKAAADKPTVDLPTQF